MKFRLFALLVIATTLIASYAIAQSPTITNVSVKDTKCTYRVGVGTRQCSIAPGMTLVIAGSNFGTSGTVSLCNCPAATIVKWTSTRVTAIVNFVRPGYSLAVETVGRSWSNAVPYDALAPVITSIVVGDCEHVPGQSAHLCFVQPGMQITIEGSYFGPQTIYSAVETCTSCDYASIVSWNPDWLTKPSPYNNQIVATANKAFCGSTIDVVIEGTFRSNYVPYTSC